MDVATALRSGEYTAAVVDIAEGLEPDLYSLLASSQVRASGTNLSGYQDPSLDPLLEAARKPGTAEERMAAWKALLARVWRPGCRCCRSSGTTRSCSRGASQGSRHGSSRPPGTAIWDVLAWRLAADR